MSKIETRTCLNQLFVHALDRRTIKSFLLVATLDGTFKLEHVVPLKTTKKSGEEKEARKIWGCGLHINHVTIADNRTTTAAIFFETVWSPPLNWLALAAKAFPKLTFVLKYEMGSEECSGSITYKDGKKAKNGDQ